jgi:hypothetical protein
MCIEMMSARIDMTFDEWKAVRPLMRRTGLFYQCDPNGIWIQLPRVATEGERKLHMKRLQPIVSALRLERLRRTG